MIFLFIPLCSFSLLPMLYHSKLMCLLSYSIYWMSGFLPPNFLPITTTVYCIYIILVSASRMFLWEIERRKGIHACFCMEQSQIILVITLDGVCSWQAVACMWSRGYIGALSPMFPLSPIFRDIVYVSIAALLCLHDQYPDWSTLCSHFISTVLCSFAMLLLLYSLLVSL